MTKALLLCVLALSACSPALHVEVRNPDTLQQLVESPQGIVRTQGNAEEVIATAPGANVCFEVLERSYVSPISRTPMEHNPDPDARASITDLSNCQRDRLEFTFRSELRPLFVGARIWSEQGDMVLDEEMFRGCVRE